MRTRRTLSVIACWLLCGIASSGLWAANVAITNFRGAWIASATYGAGVVVTFNGSSYVSLSASNKNKPPTSNPAAWSILNAPGAPGPAGPAGPRGPLGLVGPAGPSGGAIVVDSNGVEVGAWFPQTTFNGSTDIVFIRAASLTFWTGIERNRFFPLRLGYISSDCTGTPYSMSSWGVHSLARPAVVWGTVAYVFEYANPNGIVLFSSRANGGQCENLPNGGGGFNPVGAGYAPLSTTINLNVTPPFALRAE